MPVIYETLIEGNSIRLRLGEGEEGFHIVTEIYDEYSQDWVVMYWDHVLAHQVKEELIIKLFTQDER